jgi:hypothetical protein
MTKIGYARVSSFDQEGKTIRDRRGLRSVPHERALNG